MTKYKWRTIQKHKGSNSVCTIALSVFMYLFCTYTASTIHTQPQALSTRFQKKKRQPKNPTVGCCTCIIAQNVDSYITKGYIILSDNYSVQLSPASSTHSQHQKLFSGSNKPWGCEFSLVWEETAGVGGQVRTSSSTKVMMYIPI